MGHRISVIVPVHNGGDAFRRCLSCLSALSPAPEEVIVVADGDADASAELARALGFAVVELPDCRGPARARNVGAGRAHGDILLFLDADVEAPADAIARVGRAFDEHTNWVALFGSYDDQPGAANFLSQYRNLFHHHIHQTGNEEASTFWAGCGAIRRDVFAAAGGFSETYARPCIEDIELGLRLRQAGHSIGLCKDLQVKHLKVWRPLAMIQTDFFARAMPWSELILRSRTVSNDLNLRTASRVSVMAAYAVLLAMLALPWWPRGGGLALAVLGSAFLAINAPVYRFFYRKRGLAFAMMTIPWHWFYYLYGGLAFAVCLGRHLLGGHGRGGHGREAMEN